jgi:hypothetical protein
MFSLTGVRLLEEPHDASMRMYIERLFKDQVPGAIAARVDESDYQSRKMKFVTLGAIELKNALF